jgi:cytochrome c biogenesis protein CcdA
MSVPSPLAPNPLAAALAAAPLRIAALDLVRSILMGVGMSSAVATLFTNQEWTAVVGGLLAILSAVWTYVSAHPGKTPFLPMIMSLVRRGGQSGAWNGDVEAIKAALLPDIEALVDAQIKARAGILSGPLDHAANAALAQAAGQAAGHLIIS